MIARIWHGKTRIEKMEDYTRFLTNVALPDYQSVRGYKGLRFLRQARGNEADFILITFWESFDAIKAFAGEDFNKAKYYKEDQDFLLEFEENVQHYEIFAAESIGEIPSNT